MSNSFFESYLAFPSRAMESIVYITDGFWREVGDFRVHNKYPLMAGGPTPIIGIVSLYVLFVRSIGPKMMKNRQPYDLKWPIRLYNIAMTLFNAYTFYRVTALTRFGFDYFGCRQVDRSGRTKAENEMVQLAFIYFSSKIVELIDTIFFVLRKKQSQASNLHVFHHGFIAICVWVYFKIAPGGSSVLFPLLNTGVHTVMYSYYFLATFPNLRKFLWWKKYLTILQIVQFLMSMIHFSFQGLSDCNYPSALAIIGFSFNLVFLILFVDFYKRSYRNNDNENKSVSKMSTTIHQLKSETLASKRQQVALISSNNKSNHQQSSARLLVRRQIGTQLDNPTINNNNNNNVYNSSGTTKYRQPMIVSPY